MKIFFVPSKKNGGLQSERAGAAAVVLVPPVAVAGGDEDGRSGVGWRTGGDGGGGVTCAVRQNCVGDVTAALGAAGTTELTGGATMTGSEAAAPGACEGSIAATPSTARGARAGSMLL